MPTSDSNPGATLHLVGCDEAAQKLFGNRYDPIRTFLQHYLDVTNEWDEILSHELRESLYKRFVAFEQRVIQSRLGHLERMTKGHLQYRQDYLTPLAQGTGLFVSVRHQALIDKCIQHNLFNQIRSDLHHLTYPAMSEDEQNEIIVQCFRHGLFDRHTPESNRLSRPDPADIVPQVVGAYDPSLSEEQQLGAFLEMGVCRSESTARLLARTLAYIPRILAVYNPTRIEGEQIAVFLKAGLCEDEQIAGRMADVLTQATQHAISRARGLVLAAIAHGRVGLLAYSDYPHIIPLLLLQAQTDLITRLADEPLSVLGHLRADLCTLHRVLNPCRASRKEKRQPWHHQKLWEESLLHRPPDDPVRTRYRHYLTADIHQDVVQRLAQERGCSEPEADHLFITFYEGGLPLLIDWRCQVAPQTTQKTLVQQRLVQAAVQHLAALHQHHRQEIIRLVNALSAACQETGVHLPIARLLSDYPSSRYRRNLGRRIRFGFGAMVQRQMRRRTRRRVMLGRRRPRQHTVSVGESPESPEDRLVAAFTRHAELPQEDTYTETRTRLRQFITYGGIGLLPLGQWPDLLDDRVMRMLAFYKLGYPAGTIGWEDVLHKTHAYATSLGLTPPSAQLAKAVFNTYAKPARWHGGDGPAVRQVRQRQTLMLDAPRLHASWMVLPVKKRLPLPIVNAAGRQMSETCHVLLVFDTAVERPVGYWVCTTPPRSREVGLALYHAIWHPGALTWPLRGVSRHIKIPDILLADGMDDLHRAAWWFLTTIEPITRRQMDYAVQETLPTAAHLLERIADQAPDYIRWKIGSEAVTLQQAMDALRTWLHDDKIAHVDPYAQAYLKTDVFPHHHTPDVPAGIAQYGVALPGQHIPAAGWLLPVAEHPATTVRDAVEYRNVTYTDAGFRCKPGHKLAVRLFPYWYRNMEQGIFVETTPGEVRYLVWQG